MGLIRAAIGSVTGTLGDQWKEYFSCNSLENDVLMIRGTKNTKDGNEGNDNIISNGSGISVANGQCAIITDQGVITEFIAEPGVFTYDKSSESSIFSGSFNKESITNVIHTMWKRFSYGGNAGNDQRVYYFNVKEILDNKFGTSMPIPFRIVDTNLGLDLDSSVRCNGMYTFKLSNPVSFYNNVCGNVGTEYKTEQITNTLKQEFISTLQPAMAKLSELEIRPNAISAHVTELCDEMNRILTAKWSEKRGISIASIAINSITIPEEDQQQISALQRGAIMRDRRMAFAQTAAAHAEAMKAAAANPNGAMNGFVGMGFAGQAGGNSLSAMYNAVKDEEQKKQKDAAKADETANWKCACGALNKGNFCTECGKAKPEDKDTDSWTCSCGQVNHGNFCTNCGTKRPAEKTSVCPFCGFKFPDHNNSPKFCPNCGKKLGD